MTSRIAVVIDPWDYPYNGTVVSTRRFVQSLETAGYEFRILAIAGSDADQHPRCGFRKLSVPGVNHIIDRMRAPLARPDRERIRAALQGCSLLHVQFPFFLGYAAITAARELGIPVLCSFHVQPENILQSLRLPSRMLSGPLYRLFVRWFYDRADRVIAPSELAGRLLQEHGLSRPVTVLSNGVPARFAEIDRRPTAKGFRILSVGRLAREKQQETLVRAIASSRHRAEIELVLAGVGPQQRSLERLARRLGVNARIGWVDDQALIELYGSADLFIHAGTIELEGMSVLEAMAAGNSVILCNSRDSACSEFVDDDRFRFEKGDAQTLAGRIDHLLEHPDERQASGRSNRAFAATLSHDEVAGQLMRIYDEVLGAAGSAPSSPRVALGNLT